MAKHFHDLKKLIPARCGRGVSAAQKVREGFSLNFATKQINRDDLSAAVLSFNVLNIYPFGAGAS